MSWYSTVLMLLMQLWGSGQTFIESWKVYLSTRNQIEDDCPECFSENGDMIPVMEEEMKVEASPEELIKEEIEKCSISVSSDNWVVVDREAFFDMECSEAAREALEGTMATWYKDIDEMWWRAFHFRNKVSVIKENLVARSTLTDEQYERFQRVMNISSIVFGTPLPADLFMIDEHVFITSMKYAVLTQWCKVDLDKAIPSEYVPVENLGKAINAVLSYVVVNEALNAVVPPNVMYLWHHLRVIEMNNKGFTLVEGIGDEKTGLMKLKKIMTCIYLSTGGHVPRDYLYVDIEVHDWLKKLGQYEFKPRPLLTLTKKA